MLACVDRLSFICHTCKGMSIVAHTKIIEKGGCMSSLTCRHITSKFVLVLYTFFAIYNDKGGFKIRFGLYSVNFH